MEAMTVARRKLVEESVKKGLVVRYDGKTVNINKTARGVGITLWEDGSITRNDVMLELAANMTLRVARQVLGL